MRLRNIVDILILISSGMGVVYSLMKSDPVMVVVIILLVEIWTNGRSK